MLRAAIYIRSAKTSGRVHKATMSADSQAATASTRSYVNRESERGDDVHSGSSHPASVRDDGSESRAASRSTAPCRVAAASRDRLSRRARNAQGSVSSRISRSAQSAWRQGALCVGNNPRGASGSSQRSSSRSITGWNSSINSRRPPPKMYIQPSSNADANSVHSITSTSLYTSSSHSTPIISEQYDAQFCSDRVQFYADRFMRRFQIEDTPNGQIFIEDELRATYHQFYHLGAEQVDVAMEKTCIFNVDLLAATLDAQAPQRLCGGAANAVDNLHIDAVVQEPEDNDRNDRAIRRETERNAAAPDDDPGNDDSDGSDDEEDDRLPEDNNHGGHGGDNDNDNDNDDVSDDGEENPVPAAARRRRNENGNPPPPGGGAENEEADNLGD